MMTQENMIRIRYDADETGWAEKLDGDRARIANVPIADHLNIDDVVQLLPVDSDGFLVAGDVLERKFPCKTALQYDEPHVETWKLLSTALHAKGCKVEGAIPGLCVVAHAEDADPILFAMEAGIPVVLFEEDEHEEQSAATSAV
jgi:hypothetical protein